MCHLPIEIAPSENIVRAILSPSHIKQGSKEVKYQAFKSRPGTDEVSVIRHSHMGSYFCKHKGKEIEAGWPNHCFVGLIVMPASVICDCDSTVNDSRKEYCGHAHISHGFILPPNEPPPADVNLKLTERCKALRDKAVYHADSDPTAAAWTGAAF
jgi:hypothetical protein